MCLTFLIYVFSILFVFGGVVVPGRHLLISLFTGSGNLQIMRDVDFGGGVVPGGWKRKSYLPIMRDVDFAECIRFFFQKHSFPLEVDLCRIFIYMLLPSIGVRYHFICSTPQRASMIVSICFSLFLLILDLFDSYVPPRTSFEIIMRSGKQWKVYQLPWFWHRNPTNSCSKNQFPIISRFQKILFDGFYVFTDPKTAILLKNQKSRFFRFFDIPRCIDRF